jgi:hypothetical protein
MFGRSGGGAYRGGGGGGRGGFRGRGRSFKKTLNNGNYFGGRGQQGGDDRSAENTKVRSIPFRKSAHVRGPHSFSAALQVQMQKVDDALEAELGFALFTDGEDRLGWLMNMNTVRTTRAPTRMHPPEGSTPACLTNSCLRGCSHAPEQPPSGTMTPVTKHSSRQKRIAHLPYHASTQPHQHPHSTSTAAPRAAWAARPVDQLRTCAVVRFDV